MEIIAKITLDKDQFTVVPSSFFNNGQNFLSLHKVDSLFTMYDGFLVKRFFVEEKVIFIFIELGKKHSYYDVEIHNKQFKVVENTFINDEILNLQRDNGEFKMKNNLNGKLKRRRSSCESLCNSTSFSEVPEIKRDKKSETNKEKNTIIEEKFFHVSDTSTSQQPDYKNGIMSDKNCFIHLKSEKIFFGIPVLITDLFVNIILSPIIGESSPLKFLRSFCQK